MLNGHEKKKIYLDTNATTPLDPEVLQEITKVLKDHWANPSSCHPRGLQAKTVIENARRKVADMLSAEAADIVFTSGGTESNNLAINSAIHQYNLHKRSHSKPQGPIPVPTCTKEALLALPASQNGVIFNGRGEGTDPTCGDERLDSNNEFGMGEGGKSDEGGTRSRGVQNGSVLEKCEKAENEEVVSVLPHVITTSLEHDSVKLYLKHLQDSLQADVTTVGVVARGIVHVENLLAAIQPNTCLITVMLANNETGVIQPVKEIAHKLEAVNEKRRQESLPSILLHSDAAQAIGKVKVHVVDLKVNYLTVVGHKFYGPRIGALFHKDAPIHAMLYGGGQEEGMRPGTENTGMIAGLGKASELVTLKLEKYSEHMKEVRNELERRLQEAFPGEVVVHGDACNRLPNTSSISFKHPALQGKLVVGKLRVVEASVGAACHSTNVCKPSSVLLASGIPSHLAINAIRLSIGRDTSLNDLDHVIADMEQAVKAVLHEN